MYLKKKKKYYNFHSSLRFRMSPFLPLGSIQASPDQPEQNGKQLPQRCTPTSSSRPNWFRVGHYGWPPTERTTLVVGSGRRWVCLVETGGMSRTRLCLEHAVVPFSCPPPPLPLGVGPLLRLLFWRRFAHRPSPEPPALPSSSTCIHIFRKVC